MGKKSLSGKILASICSLLVFSGAAIGTTVALFTSKKDVKTHLKVGNGLVAELYLKDFTRDVLTSDGMIQEENVDLTQYQNSSGENVYVSDKGVDLSKYDKDLSFYDHIVPTMTGTMTFALYNVGQVAFNYSVSDSFVAYDEEGQVSDSAKIAEQIEYQVGFDEEKTILKAGEETLFTIHYEFMDDEENNLVMGQSFTIDFVVDMTQVTKGN